MKNLLCLTLLTLVQTSCRQHIHEAQVVQKDHAIKVQHEIRTIHALKAYLATTLEVDPELKASETIYYIPDKSSAFDGYNNSLIKLPSNNNQLYLNAYVIGYSSPLPQIFI